MKNKYLEENKTYVCNSIVMQKKCSKYCTCSFKLNPVKRLCSPGTFILLKFFKHRLSYWTSFYMYLFTTSISFALSAPASVSSLFPTLTSAICAFKTCVPAASEFSTCMATSSTFCTACYLLASSTPLWLAFCTAYFLIANFAPSLPGFVLGVLCCVPRSAFLHPLLQCY